MAMPIVASLSLTFGDGNLLLTVVLASAAAALLAYPVWQLPRGAINHGGHGCGRARIRNTMLLHLEDSMVGAVRERVQPSTGEITRMNDSDAEGRTYLSFAPPPGMANSV
jgi:hypothetical protein